MTALTLPLTVDLKQVHLTDEQFYQLCISNPELNIERNAAGGLILMSPVGGDSGSREMELGTDLSIWKGTDLYPFILLDSCDFIEKKLHY